jgi:6-phosphofructokinase
VDTVDATASHFIVKRKNGKTHTFIVTPETVITKDEKPAKLTDLTAGEAVRGTRLKSGDKSQVLKLMIGPKPASEKDASGKAKKEAADEKDM